MGFLGGGEAHCYKLRGVLEPWKEREGGDVGSGNAGWCWLEGHEGGREVKLYRCRVMLGLEKEEHAVRFRNGVKLFEILDFPPRQHLVVDARPSCIILQSFFKP